MIKDFKNWARLLESNQDELSFVKIVFPKNSKEIRGKSSTYLQLEDELTKAIKKLFQSYPNIKVESISPSNKKFTGFIYHGILDISISAKEEEGFNDFFGVFGLNEVAVLEIGHSLYPYSDLAVRARSNFRIFEELTSPDKMELFGREDKTINLPENNLVNLFIDHEKIIGRIKQTLTLYTGGLVPLPDKKEIPKNLINSNNPNDFIPSESELLEIITEKEEDRPFSVNLDSYEKPKPSQKKLLNYKLGVYLNYVAAVEALRTRLSITRHTLNISNYREELNQTYSKLEAQSKNISASELDAFYSNVISFEKEVSLKLDSWNYPNIASSAILTLRKIKKLLSITGFDKKSLEEQLTYYKS